MKLMSRYVNGNTQKIVSVTTAGKVNELNQFFNHFDHHDFSQKRRQIHDILNTGSAEEDDFQWLNTSEDEGRCTFQHVNPKKATGPDTIAPHLLTFFALYLMRVSPQILFQLLGRLHALCLYRNDLSYRP